MDSLLAEILGVKQKEVAILKESGLPSNKTPLVRSDFRRAISSPGSIDVIAEIKFASPSAGEIHEAKDPLGIGKAYEKAGAAAISLLTDRRFFKGSLCHLPRIKETTSLPILRKDFIFDEIQVEESYLMGADAVLLIGCMLSSRKLRNLLKCCRNLGIDALTEVHDQEDLTRALACDADIIGINNRDLMTSKVDLNTTVDLTPLIPNGHIIVSESGIKDGEDIRILGKAGVSAALIGTAIMGSTDIEAKAKEFVEAGKGLGRGEG